jgi:hypothetical protein
MMLIKGFCIKVLHKVEDHFASALASFIIVIIIAFCAVFWKWLKSKQTLELYSGVWLLFLLIFLFLLVYFIRSIVLNKGGLKNAGDITSGIDNWFNKNIDGAAPIVQNRPYYFANLEKDLNLKRGSSLKYLPMIAFRHGYAFEMGKKTFKLTNLTPEKDPRNIFEKHFKPIFTGEGEEVFLSCKDIDRKLGWPEGATKSWLLSRPNSNEEFEIKDEGRDKIRIVRKK